MAMLTATVVPVMAMVTPASAIAKSTTSQVSSTSAKNPCPTHRYATTRSLVPTYSKPDLNAKRGEMVGGENCIYLNSTSPGGPVFSLWSGSAENGVWVLESDLRYVG